MYRRPGGFTAAEGSTASRLSAVSVFTCPVAPTTSNAVGGAEPLTTENEFEMSLIVVGPYSRRLLALRMTIAISTMFPLSATGWLAISGTTVPATEPGRTPAAALPSVRETSIVERPVLACGAGGTVSCEGDQGPRPVGDALLHASAMTSPDQAENNMSVPLGEPR